MTDHFAKAIQLQKIKQQSLRNVFISKETKQQQLKEKIEYYKTQMKHAVVNKQTDSVQKLYEKLITLRAEQFAFNIQDISGKMITDKTQIQQELKTFYRDCYTLRMNLQPILHK